MRLPVWLTKNPFKKRTPFLNGDQMVDELFKSFEDWYSRPQPVLPHGTDEVVRWVKVIRPDLISVIDELNAVMVETATIPHDEYDKCMDLYNRTFKQITDGDTTALKWIVTNRSLF